MNIAYMHAYLEWRKQFDALFTPQYSEGDPEIRELSDGFSVRSQAYSGQKDGYSCEMSENVLLNERGETVYTWRNLDGGHVIELIQHSNGRHYLLFSTELYGYSVLEIESGRDFHYVPSKAHPGEGEEFDETFIWCDAKYDPKSNLLAVGGCIWAAPCSVLILDFSDPLLEQPSENWVDLRERLDPGYVEYGSFEDYRWDEAGNLHVRAYKSSTGGEEILCLPIDKLRLWLRENL